MHYYHILVRSARYHGREALTYASELRLTAGALIMVPLQKEHVLAVVLQQTAKPRFATKSIVRAYDLPLVPPQLLTLTDWMQQFYATPQGVVASHILPGPFTAPALASTSDLTSTKPVSASLPSLTADQKRVYAQLQHPGTVLLHGKTGSGKTRLYLERAIEAYQQGQSSIILTPEIGLTSQLAATFTAVFQERVVIIHSQLTAAERQRVWLSILRANGPVIVIGARSALFSPLANIGLLVVDECHEGAYKQEQAPYYHAIRVAARLSTLHNATLILGSATPPVTEYYYAEQKKLPVIRLQQLARPSIASTQTIVDLKNRSKFTRNHYISNALFKSMTESLARHEQSLLYLNRRGTARSVLCEHCGWQATCPHCDIPLAYHADVFELRCHTCGFHQAVPLACPSCNHPSLNFKSMGTKAIVEEVAKLFPEAKIQRFDTDNTKSERLEQQFTDIQAGKIDILIGTQLLAKGLDLPRLSTLGILAADSSLSIPDYSAQERTYQLLTQVLGRVGRGHVAGRAIIQTYHPESPIIAAAMHDNWDEFYQAELAERRKFLFPPFCHLLKLTCRRASSKAAEKAALAVKDMLEKQKVKIRIEGPAPAFHEKFQNKYQWQLIIKATDRKQLLSVIALLPTSGWTYDIDPVDLL